MFDEVAWSCPFIIFHAPKSRYKAGVLISESMLLDVTIGEVCGLPIPAEPLMPFPFGRWGVRSGPAGRSVGDSIELYRLVYC